MKNTPNSLTIASAAVASLALFVAMGGPASAGRLITGKDIAKNSVTSQQIKNNSLKGKDIKKNQIAGKHLRTGAVDGSKIAAGAIDGTKVAAGAVDGSKLAASSVDGSKVVDGSLGAADLKPGLLRARSLDLTRVIATSGANYTAALAAAPTTVLYQQGALSVGAKCFTDLGTNTTSYMISMRTTQDGAIMDSRYDSLYGGANRSYFLNTDTAFDDSRVEYDSTSANNASSDSADESDFFVIAPDGTSLRGWTGGMVKNGTLAQGNGAYGEGNVCLFSGIVFGN